MKLTRKQIIKTIEDSITGDERGMSKSNGNIEWKRGYFHALDDVRITINKIKENDPSVGE